MDFILAVIDPGTATVITGAIASGAGLFGSLTGSSSAKKAAEKQADAIAAASKRQEKVAKLQLFYQASESNKQTLIDLLSSKQASRPVYTLSTTAPMSWLDKLNWQIDSFVKRIFSRG